jgi:hypothetical protein
MLAGFAPGHRMGSYLFCESSSLLFPRLTNQNPLRRVPHAIRWRLFIRAHRVSSAVDVTATAPPKPDGLPFKRASFWGADDRGGFRAREPFAGASPAYA